MPAVYIVVAVVGTVAAGFAFKHFVYDPHIAPKVDVWTHELRVRREARRRRRHGPMPVSVDLNNAHDDRRSDTSGKSYELEDMVSKEVLDWRNGVDRAATLRQRKGHNVDSQSIASGSSTSWSLPQNASPVSIPTHILADSSSEATSTVPTRISTPLSPQVSTLRSSTSRSTLRSLPPSTEIRNEQLVAMEVSPPTPAPSTFSLTGSDERSRNVASPSTPSPAATFSSPNLVPSLSLLHPVDLDHEHDVELLSAPSSRPDSPFSNFSQPSSIGEFSATSSNEERTNPAHSAGSPLVPPPGITQVLSPPTLLQMSPPSPQSFSEMASFYQTPTTTIPGSAISRTHSELEFLSFDGDGNSTRSLSPDDISSMSSHDHESVGSFDDTDEEAYDDARDVRSEFGGSELSMASSWGGLSDSVPGSPRVARR
ncbi:hypothetical protein AAF712_002775 [Marasmius tenuissimus]|uniref:Uncharacterized protein n=1 Tax=Marasmius tenuissimus TaxID=585030 RepID=A0ABR3A9L5_9AGAR